MSLSTEQGPELMQHGVSGGTGCGAAPLEDLFPLVGLCGASPLQGRQWRGSALSSGQGCGSRLSFWGFSWGCEVRSVLVTA